MKKKTFVEIIIVAKIITAHYTIKNYKGICEFYNDKILPKIESYLKWDNKVDSLGGFFKDGENKIYLTTP